MNQNWPPRLLFAPIHSIPHVLDIKYENKPETTIACGCPSELLQYTAWFKKYWEGVEDLPECFLPYANTTWLYVRAPRSSTGFLDINIGNRLLIEKRVISRNISRYWHRYLRNLVGVDSSTHFVDITLDEFRDCKVLEVVYSKNNRAAWVLVKDSV